MMLDPMMLHTLVHLHYLDPHVVHQVSILGPHAAHILPITT